MRKPRRKKPYPQRRDGVEYPDLIPAMRALMLASGKPGVIENVPDAPLHAHLILCGSTFGLKVVRHRLFEFVPEPRFLLLSPPCSHNPRETITVCGDGTPGNTMKHRAKNGLPPNVPVAERRRAMGIGWMNRGRLAQAIPPAYSEYIARLFLAGEIWSPK